MPLREALARFPGSTLVLVSIRHEKRTWRGTADTRPIALAKLEGLVALFGGNPWHIQVKPVVGVG